MPSPSHDPADAWVDGPSGRFWGREGAAGLAVHDPARGLLLQHRAGWSDHGGTWGFPGGARHTGEAALTGALRESAEEAGVPSSHVAVLGAHLRDHDYWSYTTVLARAVVPFEPVMADAESIALRWVALADVGGLALHPGVAALWPQIRSRLTRTPVLLVDVANVMGARPDGWWKDRAGAAERLVARLAGLARAGVPGHLFGEDAGWRLWPRIVAVVEGQAARAARLDDLAGSASRGLTVPAPGGEVAAHTASVEVVRARGDGDTELLETIARLHEADTRHDVTLVTSDRALRGHAEALGAQVAGSRALTQVLSVDH